MKGINIIMTPKWTKSLADVLGYQTQEITKISPRTGNEYQTDSIAVLKVFSTGSIEALADDKYRYSVVDPTKNLEYAIKTSNKVDTKFGNVLLFRNVVGGATNSGGWYSADSVEVVQKNA